MAVDPNPHIEGKLSDRSLTNAENNALPSAADRPTESTFIPADEDTAPKTDNNLLSTMSDDAIAELTKGGAGGAIAGVDVAGSENSDRQEKNKRIEEERFKASAANITEQIRNTLNNSQSYQAAKALVDDTGKALGDIRGYAKENFTQIKLGADNPYGARGGNYVIMEDHENPGNYVLRDTDFTSEETSIRLTPDELATLKKDKNLPNDIKIGKAADDKELMGAANSLTGAQTVEAEKGNKALKDAAKDAGHTDPIMREQIKKNDQMIERNDKALGGGEKAKEVVADARKATEEATTEATTEAEVLAPKPDEAQAFFTKNKPAIMAKIADMMRTDPHGISEADFTKDMQAAGLAGPDVKRMIGLVQSEMAINVSPLASTLVFKEDDIAARAHQDPVITDRFEAAANGPLPTIENAPSIAPELAAPKPNNIVELQMNDPFRQ